MEIYISDKEINLQEFVNINLIIKNGFPEKEVKEEPF